MSAILFCLFGNTQTLASQLDPTCFNALSPYALFAEHGFSPGGKRFEYDNMSFSLKFTEVVWEPVNPFLWQESH